MLLKDLIKNIYSKPLSASDEKLDIHTISSDSRQQQPQGLFVTLDGFKVKGEEFIKDAVSQGAVAIVKRGANRVLPNYTIPDSICVLDVDQPKDFLRQITLRFYDNPSFKVKTIGVTGTNGKTTITYLLESILKANHQSCAVVGTINYRVAGKVTPSKNTTPGFLDNQQLLFNLVNSKIPYCVMEVSSHALEQGRVDAIDFKGAIFTNLTQDHLDYHKDMENYFKAKAILFENLGSEAWAMINQDDAYGSRLFGLSKGKRYTYSIDSKADIKAGEIEYTLKGTRMMITFPSGKINIQTSFIGKHNVYNILAAAGAAFNEGIGLEIIQKGIQQLSCVPGRLQPVEAGQDFSIFIDYAHTEDGLINVLKALRNVSPNKIILVFGCGGDRDKGKRVTMGRAACELADHSIVTSDNPRGEEPIEIINQITPGFTKSNFEIEPDRTKAIKKALEIAEEGQIVLIAGKGHEDYQILKDKTISFNEEAIVKDFLTSKRT